MRLTTWALVLGLSACGDKDDTGPVGGGDQTDDTSGDVDDTADDDTGDEEDPPPDSDGDGYHDGIDCAPDDPDIHPGAEDIAYDGIDQDCDGLDLTDWDEDGYDSDIVGGSDCNDEDPSINPGAIDEENDIDDDCDGEIDEDVPIIPTDWPIRIGGANATVTTPRLSTTEDGTLVVFGSYIGFVDFEPQYERSEGTESENNSADLFLGTFPGDRTLGSLTEIVADEDTETSPGGLHVDGGGSMTVAGVFQGTLDFDAGPPLYTRESPDDTNGYVARFDSAGAVEWATSFGGEEDDTATDVDVGATGTTFVVGSFRAETDFWDAGSTNTGNGATSELTITATGDSDGVLAAYDTSGATQWASVMAASTAGETVTPVAVLAGLDTVYVVGMFDGTVDLDPSEEGADSHTAGGSSDAFIAAYAATDGSLEWSAVLPCSASATVTRATLDASENILLVGSFTGTIDLDPGTGVSAEATVGGADAFAVSLDASGAHTWSTAQGGTGDDSFTGGASDGAGGAVLTGGFEDTVAVGGTTLTSAGASDCLVLRLDSSETATWARTFGSADDEVCWDLSLASDDNVYFTGPITSPIDFSVSGADDLRRAVGDADAWIHRLPLTP